MRILWVGTKSPWPPIDGGRLLGLRSLEALADCEVHVTVVAPVGESNFDRAHEGLRSVCRPELVKAKPNGLLRSVVRAWRDQLPLAVARHHQPQVVRRVRSLLRQNHYDLVHIEQVQATSVVSVVEQAGVPWVLRTQNVESDLWFERADRHPLRPILRRVAVGLRRWEGDLVRRAPLTVSVSNADAERLRKISGGIGRVEYLPVPFVGEMPAGRSLLGEPAVVILAGGWWPNGDGARWFVQNGWPVVAEQLPNARLHLFGGPRIGGARVDWHQSPGTSEEALGEGTILAVPLKAASGVRMKILEAWSRGVVVVASERAAQGLEGGANAALLVGEGPIEMAEAIVRVAQNPDLGERLRNEAKNRLSKQYAPGVWADACLEMYSSVARG